MDKRTFVKELLQPLVMELDSTIDYLEYVKATPSNEEYVIVWYNGRFPSGNRYRCLVNVTANSLSQIAIDVITRVK